MKKVSTVAAKQRKNCSQPTLTIGLDLGDRNSWYFVLDEAGQIQLEQRVRTSEKGLEEVFGGMPRSRIALEIGTHSPCRETPGNLLNTAHLESVCPGSKKRFSQLITRVSWGSYNAFH